jgi:hypothetical protein
MHALPRGGEEPQCDDLLECGDGGGEQELIAESCIFGSVPIASKRVAKIENVVADEAEAMLDDDGVEGICRFGVGVVQPCIEDT